MAGELGTGDVQVRENRREGDKWDNGINGNVLNAGTGTIKQITFSCVICTYGKYVFPAQSTCAHLTVRFQIMFSIVQHIITLCYVRGLTESNGNNFSFCHLGSIHY